MSSRGGCWRCHYEHRWREEGLSDHAPIVARLRSHAQAGSFRARTRG